MTAKSAWHLCVVLCGFFLMPVADGADDRLVTGGRTLTVPGGWAAMERSPLAYDFSALGDELRKAQAEHGKVLINPAFTKVPDWVWKDTRYGRILQEKFSNGKTVAVISPLSHSGEVYKLRYLGHLCKYLKTNFADLVGGLAVGEVGFKTGTDKPIGQLIAQRFHTWGWNDEWRLYRWSVQHRFTGLKAINDRYRATWGAFTQIVPPQQATDAPHFRDWLVWVTGLIRQRYLQEAVVVRRYGFPVKCLAPLPAEQCKLPSKLGERKAILGFVAACSGPYTTVEYLRKVKSVGINCMVTYGTALGWEGIESRPGSYNFVYLDSFLRTLRRVGLKAIIRQSTDRLPDWVWQEMEDPARKSALRFANGKTLAEVFSGAYTEIVPPTGNPRFAELRRRYSEALCGHLKEEFSDVVDYVSAGEFFETIWCAPPNPGKETWTWDEYSIANYRRFLKERYTNVAALRQEYHSNHEGFDKILPPRVYEDSKYFWDWKDWTYVAMADLYRRQSELVRRHGFKVYCLAHNGGVDETTKYVLHREDSATLETVDAELTVIAFPIPDYTKGGQIYEGYVGDPNQVAWIYLYGQDGFCSPAETYEWIPPKIRGLTGEQMLQELKECIDAVYPNR